MVQVGSCLLAIGCAGRTQRDIERENWGRNQFQESITMSTRVDYYSTRAVSLHHGPDADAIEVAELFVGMGDVYVKKDAAPQLWANLWACLREAKAFDGQFESSWRKKGDDLDDLSSVKNELDDELPENKCGRSRAISIRWWKAGKEEHSLLDLPNSADCKDWDSPKLYECIEILWSASESPPYLIALDDEGRE